jgi:hypothetical protein
VLGADIVYNEEYIGELIASLLALLRCGGTTSSSDDDAGCDHGGIDSIGGGCGGAVRETQALISYEQRRRDMQASFFEKLRAAGCDCERQHSPMLDHAALVARVFVYKVTLGSGGGAAPAVCS